MTDDDRHTVHAEVAPDDLIREGRWLLALIPTGLSLAALTGVVLLIRRDRRRGFLR